MTDQQIANFLVHRAAKNSHGMNLCGPKLVLVNRGKKMYLGICFDNCNKSWIVRFTKNNMRGLFKIEFDDNDFKLWKANCLATHNDSSFFLVDYDVNSLPSCIVSFVSNAILDALKEDGVGFDMMNITIADDIPLIDPHETYEEIAIETDLMDFTTDFMQM